MGQYTDFFEDKSYDISYEDDYIEELRNVLNKFRTFDKALDSFIVEHGFCGDISNIDEKVSFISDKYKSAQVPVPRNLKDWYTKNVVPERTSKTPFYLCFAFRLSVDEANEFLRKILLFRGFDCHNINEIVYFYALKNGLDYPKVNELLSRVHTKKVKEDNIGDLEETIYTETIIQNLDEIETEEELVNYLNENIHMFKENNVRAYKIICDEWKNIIGDSGHEGLAIRERNLLYRSFDKEAETSDGSHSNGKTKEKIRKERKRADDSTWEIFLQILGLSGSHMSDFYAKRSLKFMLNDNELLHPMAAHCFPDREGLNMVLNGGHLSHERVRKLMILLVFYNYYASKAIKNKGYFTDEIDEEGCIFTINDKLISAKYPALYPANPYDFIFFTAIRSEHPLFMFREYMQEMFFEKAD